MLKSSFEIYVSVCYNVSSEQPKRCKSSFCRTYTFSFFLGGNRHEQRKSELSCRIVDQIFIQKIAEESGFTADYICAALLRLFRGEKKRIHGYCIE